MPSIDYYRDKTWRIFIGGDTTTIRVLLALGSLGWTIALWLPLHTFERPGYLWLRFVAGEWAWGFAFFLHFAGVLWRTYDPLPRVRWALAVNGYGILLWIYVTGALTFAVGEYSPGTALEWCLITAASIALYRTGFNDEVVSP